MINILTLTYKNGKIVVNVIFTNTNKKRKLKINK